MVFFVAPHSSIGIFAHGLKPRKGIADNDHRENVILVMLLHGGSRVIPLDFRHAMLSPRHLPQTWFRHANILLHLGIEEIGSRVEESSYSEHGLVGWSLFAKGGAFFLAYNHNLFAVQIYNLRKVKRSEANQSKARICESRVFSVDL